MDEQNETSLGKKLFAEGRDLKIDDDLTLKVKFDYRAILRCEDKYDSIENYLSKLYANESGDTTLGGLRLLLDGISFAGRDSEKKFYTVEELLDLLDDQENRIEELFNTVWNALGDSFPIVAQTLQEMNQEIEEKVKLIKQASGQTSTTLLTSSELTNESGTIPLYRSTPLSQKSTKVQKTQKNRSNKETGQNLANTDKKD